MTYFFDLDNTLTRSRTIISEEMKSVLLRLPRPFFVISGASYKQMLYQLDGVPAVILSQNGNDTPFWRDAIEDPTEIISHIKSMGFSDDTKFVENRGCQVSLSIAGHGTPIEIKEKVDPDKEVRKRLLAQHPFISDEYEVKIAGTTCFDYFKKGHHKGYNIQKIVDMLSLRKENCLYIGDALFSGGNDESVIGVIPTHAVSNFNETYGFLENIS